MTLPQRIASRDPLAQLNHRRTSTPLTALHSATRLVPLALSVVVAVLVGGCVSSKPGKPVAPPLAEVLGKGWQCYASPTGFEAPGSIFTLGPDGDKRDEVDLSGSYEIRAEPRAIGALHQDGGFSANFTLKLLQNAIPNLTLTADTEAAKRTATTVRVDDALEERSYDADLQKAKDWVFNHRHIFDGRRRAYVVRNALVVRKMTYELDSSFIAAIGGQVKYEEIAEISGQPAEARKPGTTEYKLTFSLPDDKRLRVCVLPQQIIIPTGAAGPGAVTLADVNEDLKIRPVD